MVEISKNKLKHIAGGTSISGTVINAIVGIIKIIEDIGKAFGSSIRRIEDDSLCPLK